MTKFNIIGLRGFIGSRYSRGVDEIVHAARATPDWEATNYAFVDSYDNWRSYLAKLGRWRDPTILVGHSFGANAWCEVLRRLPPLEKIALFISIDPSPYYSFRIGRFGPGGPPDYWVPVLNMYQQSDWLIRGQRLDWPGAENHLIRATGHKSIDDEDEVQDRAKESISIKLQGL